MYRISTSALAALFLINVASANDLIESGFTTPWLGQVDAVEEISYSHFNAYRLGNSHGFLTAYPHATFGDIGFNDFITADRMIISEYGNYNNFLPAVLGSSFPPFLPPYIPPDNPHVVPEPNLTVHLLIIGLVVLIFIKIRKLMCKNM